ncbi:MAG: LysM peptidoglycan-binding domain-containing protein [Candidatus Kapabacteria bacterium]|nr:LysM peptidoglycan-binding domain-containing protein [Candidatus Kapabacteria bacterium]
MNLKKNHIKQLKQIILFFLIVIPLLAANAAYAQKTIKPKPSAPSKPIFPDKYSDLDDAGSNSTLNDENILSSLEKARQKYVRALSLIHKHDTTSSLKLFEEAIEILNKLVSYPGIEHNANFTDLAQTIIEDYEEAAKNVEELDESVSLFILREKISQEVEKTSMLPNIKTIILPKDTSSAVVEPSRPITVIPLDTNDYVRKNIEFLTQNKKGKHFIQTCFERSSKWFPLLKRIIAEETAPPEIVYLAMIESALNPTIVSGARAVGMWQFIRETGERYNLNKNPSIWIDERRDPEKATRAAMRFLKDLYNQFGNWHLVMAAYDCGPNRIARVVAKSNIDKPTFWDIFKSLPRETRNYVPSFIAVTKIMLQPELFGLKPSEYKYLPEYKYDTYSLTEPVNLQAIAKAAGTSLEEIAALNSELTKSCTPPDLPKYDIKIPVGTLSTFTQNFANLTAEEKKPWLDHEVRKGETIAKIAKKYNISSKDLCEINELKSVKSKVAPGTKLHIPVDAQMNIAETAPAPKTSTSSAKKTDDNKSDSEEIVRHTIKPGETLYSIAQIYGVRLTDLRTWNDIPFEEDNIPVGRELIIAKNQTNNDQAPVKVTKIEKTKTINHKVKKGETLAKIADEYNVSIESIKKQNHLKKNAVSKGQVLAIKVNSKQKTTSRDYAEKAGKSKVIHKVKAGESLFSIAAKYGVSEDQIKEWNPGKVAGETVYKGSNLKILGTESSKGSGKSKKDSAPKTYKVRKGDTLNSIASKFGVSTSSLKAKNKKLKKGDLLIGQIIKIQ